ncbi:MAG: hypothetical protein ACRDQH_13660 [Pseudonocardiaceae bacterium]
MSTPEEAYAARELLALATDFERLAGSLAAEAVGPQSKRLRWHRIELSNTYRDCADRARERAVKLSSLG